MSKYTRGVLTAFILGQLVQLLAHAISANFSPRMQLYFCSGLGFLLVVAFLAGSRTLRQEIQSLAVLPAWQPKKKEGAHEIETD